MNEALKVSAGEYRLIGRLRAAGARVVRQSSELESAIRSGRGYVYFLHPGGKALSAPICIGLMQKGLIESAGDDLFSDVDRGGQTYRLVSPLPALKAPRTRRPS